MNDAIASEPGTIDLPARTPPSLPTGTPWSQPTMAKYHGIGNDFLVLLDPAGDVGVDADLARRLCERHRGIGADGLIRGRLADAGGDALLTFELWNADGSMAEMSGNGMRCLAHAALDAGLVPAGAAFGVVTSVGRKEVTIRPNGPGRAWAGVAMGIAVIDGDAQRCNVGHGELLVDMGNPHLVLLGPDPATIDVGRLGPELGSGVPAGRNVEFVTLGPGPDEVTMRVWERGVGETLACGTGSCAAAVALHHWGRVGTRVTVHQPGGAVVVEIGPGLVVALSGPSERIAGVVSSDVLGDVGVGRR